MSFIVTALPINKLAKKFGTPLYLYSATAIRERYRILERAFHHVRHTLCYSVKANSNLSILRLLAGMGAGFDIVSGGELERVRRAQKKALRKVVFSGVGKTADELKLALRSGILLFNVESEGELELLAACASELRKTASFALRVNPDVSRLKRILTSPPACASTNSGSPSAAPANSAAGPPSTSTCGWRV